MSRSVLLHNGAARVRAPAPPPFLVDAALALRSASLRLADRLLPASTAVWAHTMGIERTYVIGTLAELGVADALGAERRTAAELARRVGADADVLHRLLRAAATHGIVRLDRRGRFRLTRLGRALRSDAPGGVQPIARFMALPSMVAAWSGLAESARDGRSAFPRVHGVSLWEWLAAHPAEGALFADAMRAVTRFDAPAVAAAKLWPREGTVCDVGGGAGTLIAALLTARPGLRAVLVESASMLPSADANLARHGVRERVELVEGDLFGEVPAGADVYVLKSVLHDWDDATCARILRTVRAAMRPGARLVVIEQIQERNRPHPLASSTDVLMLIQTDDGRERSRRELRDVLARAGLRPGRIKRAGAVALIEATA